MKVMHVLPNGGSGIESLVCALVPHLSSFGVENHLVYLSDVAIPMTTLPGAVSSTTVFQLRRRPLSSVFEFRSMVRRVRPDVIHAHSFLPTVLAAIAGSSARHVRTVHAPYPYFSSDDIKSRLKRSLEVLVLIRTGSWVVAVSKFVSESLPKILRPRVKVVYNGVPLTSLPDPLRMVDGITIVAVGRLETEKGYPRLIAAFAEVLRDVPDARLLIAGDGTRRRQIEDQIVSLGIGYAVRLLGHVPNVLPLFCRARLHVLSSDYEGLGLTVLEALCMGCPVASTPIPSIQETALRACCDIEFASDMSSSALAAAMRRIIMCNDDREASRLQTAHAARAVFAAEICASTYLNLYRDRVAQALPEHLSS